MTDNQLKIIKRALIDADARDAAFYESLPEVNITHSDEYNKRIEKLFSGGSARITYTPRRIVAIIIAAALIFALSVTAFAFRDSIKKFFFGIYENFVYISSDGDGADPSPMEIEQLYTISGIPDGYEKILETREKAIAQQCWASDTGAIILQQAISKNTTISSSNENGIVKEVKIGNRDTYMIYEEGSYTFHWEEAGYLFMLNASDTLSYDTVTALVENVRAAE